MQARLASPWNVVSLVTFTTRQRFSTYRNMSAPEVVSEPAGSNAPMSKEDAKVETLRQGE